MRPTFVIAAAALAALTAACDNDSGIRISSREDGAPAARGVLRVVETLQCPESQGVLTRKGAPSVDGLSCTYSGPRGSEVVLRLVSLDGADAAATLLALERTAQQALPRVLERIASSPTPPQAPATGGGDSVDVAVPGVAVKAEGERAVIRLPGLSINADGENARVRVGGLNITADDTNARVNVESDDESVQIRAQDDSAEIRTRETGGGVRASYVLVDEAAPEGQWRLAGFEARGPAVGPLVVAEVRSRNRREDDLFDSAKALVTLNVGD